MKRLLQHGITEQASVCPEAVALAFKGTRLTYAQLDDMSSRLAHVLIDVGCRRGDRVAVLMPKVPMAIVAILGALKADAIYVPMDPSSPAARLSLMLQAAECRLILAAGPVGQTLRGLLAQAEAGKDKVTGQPPRVGWLDDAPPPEGVPAAFTRDALDAFLPTAPATVNGDEDIAHILFTSGSTGVPKGVTIQHRSVLRFIDWARAYFGTSPGERISQHPPLHFDLSTFDIFGTLSAGAELHLVPHELNLLPNKLSQFIFDNRLTQWFSVPSVLNMMAKFDVVVQDDFPELRRILWCGEAIPTPTLMYWMRRLPHVQFTNLYGPTEATIASSYYTVPECPASAQEAIPIGRPCDGEELLVLDADLRPVPQGEIGDLYIRGAGLSPGYWRDPEKTRAVFLPYVGHGRENRSAGGGLDRIYKTGDLARLGADGLLYFVGRADTQIKSRGYRIELGEIEAALHSLSCLRESAVVAVPSDGFEGWKICCAYVPASGAEVGVEALRKSLAGLLPAYMLPALWAHHDALPKNVNGKIDRPALKAAFANDASRAAPRAAVAASAAAPADAARPAHTV